MAALSRGAGRKAFRGEFGGFKLLFKSDSTGIISILGRRYAPFSLKGAGGLELACSAGPARQSPFRPEAVLAGKRLELRRGDFYAGVDLAAGRGSAVLAPNEQCLDAFLRSLVSSLLIRSGGLMLHSAGLLRGGKAYLFPGVSGAGKSTLSKLAQAAGAEVISDEINMVRFEAGKPVVYGSPFWGEMRSGGRRGRWRLGGLFLPKKAALNRVRACPPAETFRALMRCLVNFSRQEEAGRAAMRNATRLLAAAPGARLEFSKKNADFLGSVR